MAKSRRLGNVRLTLERLEGREVPAASPWMLETFDQTTIGALPSGWLLHGSEAGAGFAASPTQALGPDNGLRSIGASTTETRTWSNIALPSDAQISANVFL